jgi:hypothetical protein
MDVVTVVLKKTSVMNQYFEEKVIKTQEFYEID